MGLENQLVATAAAAAILDVHEKTLSRWRQQGIGPRFVKLGPRCVRYERVELVRFKRASRRRSTGDDAPKRQVAVEEAVDARALEKAISRA